jgi:cysteine desulfurase/selenocysteine lyase
MTQMSNVLGTINPVEQIIDMAHSRGAIVLVDAAQSIPHMPVDVVAMGADFVAFSSHKMLGPTGIGVLYARRALLEEMPPFNFGGEMIGEVHYDHVSWAEIPHKFEGGTPNIAGTIGFAPALDYLSQLGMENVRNHEHHLTQYALDKISRLNSIRIVGPLDASDRGGAITFVDKDVHPHDMAQFLDTRGLAVRAGHHCAQPLHKRLGLNSTVRASFYIYNTETDIDMLVNAIREARRYFGHE